MPERRPSVFIATALMALAPGLLLAQAAPMSAEQGWSAVARCAKEDSVRARHDCVDRLMREAGLLTDEIQARQQRRAFGMEGQPPAPSRPPAPAPVAAPAAQPPPVPAAPENPDRLEAAISSVQIAADGRLSVTTADGAVWRQTESVDMPQPPRAGDRMIIRKGAMSGYRCSIRSSNLLYRCERTR